MKKRSILNLIKYYAEQNDPAFRAQAYEIARDFDQAGDYQIAEYVMALLSDASAFVPQENITNFESAFMTPVHSNNKPLPLPDVISDDVRGIVNAVGRNVGLNKFLFAGPPGTGKTETAKRVARILEREILAVNFSDIVDSKLGQTGKNIAELFAEIRRLPAQSRYIILFDELDALVLDRADSRDLREMGRATSIFLRELDDFPSHVVLIATTNLYDYLDKAVVRRFDYVVDFDRYSRDDLVEIAEKLVATYIDEYGSASKNKRLLTKILAQVEEMPYPADLANIIRTSIAFGDPNDGFSYLRRMYQTLTGGDPSDIYKLQDEGFTMREIEVLAKVPKSTVAREVRGRQ